jgi:hypothetical protein
MPTTRMAHNGVASVRYNNLGDDDCAKRLRYIDEWDLPAHEPRMEDGLFAAQRTVENRR